jgi:hypothetical protein
MGNTASRSKTGLPDNVYTSEYFKSPPSSVTVPGKGELLREFGKPKDLRRSYSVSSRMTRVVDRLKDKHTVIVTSILHSFRTEFLKTMREHHLNKDKLSALWKSSRAEEWAEDIANALLHLLEKNTPPDGSKVIFACRFNGRRIKIDFTAEFTKLYSQFSEMYFR